MMLFLPAFGLEVVDMDMLALGDGPHEAADILAIFDRGVVDLRIRERDLVAERYILLHEDREGAVILGHHPEGVGAGGQSFDHDDRDIVLAAMRQNMRVLCILRYAASW